MKWWIFLFAGLFSLVLTGFMRNYAVSWDLLAVPERRSSHSTPVPLGGGPAIAAAFLTALLYLRFAGLLQNQVFWALAGAGSWSALIGWLDDHLEMDVWPRLAGHFAGAVWALAFLGGLPPLEFLGHEMDLGFTGDLLAVIFLVWMINLYNFMDGIDGIASIEAVAVYAGGAFLWTVYAGSGTGWMLPLAAASAAGGFLFWNFPKARIFMGNSGSEFLGMVLGIFALQAAHSGSGLFWGWIILSGAFIVDATLTLMIRAWQGKKVYLAHCNHAYQHAARKYGAHWPVSLAFGAITVFWLLPLAFLVVQGFVEGTAGVIVAWLPLAAAAVWFKAGRS
ncbi:MAG: MraY family glycosyltransferase [Desulfosalsimonas sp.]